jgi:hypothetical protein
VEDAVAKQEFYSMFCSWFERNAKNRDIEFDL